MIACKRCPFGFPGDVVCMKCATGYAIGFDEGRHPGVGQTFPLTQIFRMTTSRLKGKIRCETFTEAEPTGLTITVDSKTVEYPGQTHETLDYPTTDLVCPQCNEKQLRFYLADPARCPQCGELALRKHVTFGPILLPPRDDTNDA